MTRERRQVLVLLLLGILTSFAAVILVARRPGMGPVVVALTDTKGIHLGDIPVLGLWVIGLVCGVILWRDRSD